MSELTHIQTVVCLQSCDLFSFCRAEEVMRIAEIARERLLEPGEVVYGRGTVADHLHSVVRGRVRLESVERPERTAGPLSTFGVREILSGRLRSERAVAVEETLLLSIDAEDFFDLLSSNIEIVKALFRHLLEESPGPGPLAGE